MSSQKGQERDHIKKCPYDIAKDVNPDVEIERFREGLTLENLDRSIQESDIMKKLGLLKNLSSETFNTSGYNHISIAEKVTPNRRFHQFMLENFYFF